MATARYVCLFLKRRGHLQTVYRAVRDRDLGLKQSNANWPQEPISRHPDFQFSSSITRIVRIFTALPAGLRIVDVAASGGRLRPVTDRR